MTRLDELIMGSDVARKSLRARQEEISSTVEATRKRKYGKNIEAAKIIKKIEGRANKAGK